MGRRVTKDINRISRSQFIEMLNNPNPPLLGKQQCPVCRGKSYMDLDGRRKHQLVICVNCGVLYSKGIVIGKDD